MSASKWTTSGVSLRVLFFEIIKQNPGIRHNMPHKPPGGGGLVQPESPTDKRLQRHLGLRHSRWGRERENRRSQLLSNKVLNTRRHPALRGGILRSEGTSVETVPGVVH